MGTIGARDDVREGELTRAIHEGTTYLLTKVGNDYYVIENRCPHLGWSMARGEVREGVLRCPWHGSRYDVCTGENLDWVNAFAGVRMPTWSHRLIALGKDPGPVRSHKLIVDGDSLRFPSP